MAVRVFKMGQFPANWERYIATTEVELKATTPAVEFAEGKAIDTKRSWEWFGGSWQPAAGVMGLDASGNLVPSGPVKAATYAQTLRGMRSVLALGDSITASAQATGTGFSWAEQAVVMSRGRMCMVKNAAVPGTTIQDWIANFSTYVGTISTTIPISDIWCQIGTNNSVVTAEGADAAAARIPALIAVIRAAYPQANITLFGIPPLIVSKTFAADFNSLVRGIAQANGCSYKYLWEDVIDPATGLLATAYQGGISLPNVHPSWGAHKLAATNLTLELFGTAPTKNIGLDAVVDSTNPTRVNGAVIPAKDCQNYGTPGAGTGFAWGSAGGLTGAIVANTPPMTGNKQTWTGSPLPANANTGYTKTYAIDKTHNYLLTFAMEFTNTANAILQLRNKYNSGVVSLIDYGLKLCDDGFSIEGVMAKIIHASEIPSDTTAWRMDVTMAKMNNANAATAVEGFSAIQLWDLGP